MCYIYIYYTVYINKCVPFEHRHMMQSRLIGKVKPDGAARSNCHWEFSAIPSGQTSTESEIRTEFFQTK